MPSELYEVLAQGARYWFLLLMALIVWRSYRWYRRDRRQTRKRLKLLPDAGYVGELVVTRGAGQLHTGDVLAVPREGMLGALRSNDLCVPAPGVARRHLWFRYDAGKGLMVEPLRGQVFSVDGEPVQPKRPPHMAHGSRLLVGEVELRLRMFAGFESVSAPRSAARASAPRMPDEPTPTPDAAAQSWAMYQWMMQQYAQQQASQQFPAGGYAPPGGYAAPNGYPVPGGYPMQGGTANSGSYAAQVGYATPGGYPMQVSYAAPDGYPADGYPAQGGCASSDGYPAPDECLAQDGYVNSGSYPAQGGYASTDGYPTPDALIPPDQLAQLTASLTPDEAVAYASQLTPAQAEQFADAYAVQYAARASNAPAEHAPFMRPADQPTPEWLRAVRDPDYARHAEPQQPADMRVPDAPPPATPSPDESPAPYSNEAPASHDQPADPPSPDEPPADWPYAPLPDDLTDAYEPGELDEDMTDAAAPPRSAYIGHDEAERAKRHVWDKYLGGRF